MLKGDEFLTESKEDELAFCEEEDGVVQKQKRGCDEELDELNEEEEFIED